MGGSFRFAGSIEWEGGLICMKKILKRKQDLKGSRCDVKIQHDADLSPYVALEAKRS